MSLFEEYIFLKQNPEPAGAYVCPNCGRINPVKSWCYYCRINIDNKEI